MIETCRQHNIFPRKLGLFKNKGDPQQIVNSQNIGLTVNVVKLYCAGLKHFADKIEKLNISKNNIQDKYVEQIIGQLSDRTTVLDMSNNKMRNRSCEKLSVQLQLKLLNLRELNLSDNQLQDQCLQQFLRIYSEKPRENLLTKLNLSKNLITDKSVQYIKEILIKSCELLELYIGWNSIRAAGFKLIGESLLQNKFLKVLDLSYNKIGGNNDTITFSALQEWIKVFQKDSQLELIHLDLSFNKFTIEESKFVVDGIQNNHSILGFHFKGNHCDIDNNGFLFLQDKYQENNFQSEWHILQYINGVQPFKLKNTQQNCWICEGWEENVFFWKPYISGTYNSDFILIHFDFDNFQPHQMIKQQNYYIFKKMCPPNRKIYYFYTILGMHVFSKEIQIKSENVLNKYIIIHYSDTKIPAFVPRMNYQKCIQNLKLFNFITYQPNFESKPRVQEIINYLAIKAQIAKYQIWRFETSIFKDFKKDDDELLDKCFEKDWADSKIEKFIPQNQLQPVKTLLRSKYFYLKSAYKHYASISPSGEIWSIGQNVYTEIMHTSKIQTINYGTSNISLNFVNVNASSQFRNQQQNQEINNNPANSLIRYQFMEVLVRNIYDKFVRTGLCQTFQEAWSLQFEEGIKEMFSSIINESQWRENSYWNENSEICIKRFKPLIEKIYQQYAGIKTKQISKNKYLSYEDFKFFVNESRILGEDIGERDVNTAYNLSMMTQIDEISNSRHMQMSKLEFYEALARLSDSLNPLPYGFEEDIESWPLEIRMNLEISIKLESLLVQLYRKQDKYFKEDNKIENQSLYHDELIAIKNGKQLAQRARKNVQQKVMATIRRQSQSIQFAKRVTQTSLITALGILNSGKQTVGSELSQKLTLSIFANKNNNNEKKLTAASQIQNAISEEQHEGNQDDNKNEQQNQILNQSLSSSSSDNIEDK